MEIQSSTNNKINRIQNLLHINGINRESSIDTENSQLDLRDGSVNATSLEQSDNSNVNTLMSTLSNNQNVTGDLSDHLSRICRTCLDIKSDLRPLYDACLPNMIMTFAAITVRISVNHNNNIRT